MSPLTEMLAYLDRLDEYLEKELQEWLDESTPQNLAYRFSWGENAVRMAARQSVADLVRVKVSKADSLEDVAKWLLEETLRMSRNVPSSTSVISNFVENLERSYMAEMLDMVKDKLAD